MSGPPAVGVDLCDTPARLTVTAHQATHHGHLFDMYSDTVVLPDGQSVVRDVLAHTGAVAVLAMDDAGLVLVVRQYRHPVRAYLWEIPAGLLDVPGEDPVDCARRELREEAHHEAARWDVLVDLATSPGISEEGLRVFLARDVVPAAGPAHDGDGEERDMPRAWVPLADLVAGVLSGRLCSPSLVAGVLAAARARESGWATLRPAGAPWRLGPHPGYPGREGNP